MEVRFDDGQLGTARQLDGNILTLEGPRAFAPGAPIRFVASPLGEVRSYEGRTLGSKRLDDDERFVVRMRFVNLTREDRAMLTEALND
ncbi:MAG: hypothetical protein WBG86_16210 [Polyangiales bacterium]